MEGFYAKINQQFASVIYKNEAIISEIESVKEKITKMLEDLTIRNDAIIDEVQLYQQSANKEFKQLYAELVPKVTLGSLEQRAATAEEAATKLRNDQTRYLKQIEDLEFEVKNLKSVSLLSQKDKYNRTLQIEVESLEKKLKAADARYKALEERIASANNQPSTAPEPVAPEPVAPEPVAPEPVAPEPVAPETVAPETVAPETVAPEPEEDVNESSEDTMTRCYARIGTDKISPDSLTPDEISAYPSDVYKSKTGKFLGKPCINLVRAIGDVFCAEHATGFSDIRAEPPSDGEKPKKKKKATSVATTEPVVETPTVEEPSQPVVSEPSQPVVSEPSQPVVSEPVVSEPVVETNAVVEPVKDTQPVVVEPAKEKKTRKKKVATEEPKVNAEEPINSTEQTQDTTAPAPIEEKIKKPRKKKADAQVSADGAPEQVADVIAPTTEETPGSQSSTPGSKRGRKKKETPPTPTRTPVTQKEYILKEVEGVTKVSKPDWAFIEPWDSPEGVQYVIDTKTNYVFEATETGEIGAWTGFMRV